MLARASLALTIILAAGTARPPNRQQIKPDEVCGYQGLFVGPCFTVHGRMGAYNGAPPYRIWIIGTTRLLGVDHYRGCVVPPALDTLVGVQDRYVYADFVVRPLTADEPGVMRIVCVASAAHIVTRPAYFINPPPR